MNKFLKIFFLVAISVLVVNCNKDDEDASTLTPTPLKDYKLQYDEELIKIEEYLSTHYISSYIDNPGASNDQDVEITKIPNGGTQTSIKALSNLKSRTVKDDGIEYKLYFLELRKGGGDRPCNVDNVNIAYKGTVLSTSTEFDFNNSPETKFALLGVIRGWSEILPQFNGAVFSQFPDGSTRFDNFGAGIMFIPSGLAYYNAPPNSSIPAYSPLIFKFKLYGVERDDFDFDGIPSYLEDLMGVNNVPADYYLYGNTINSISNNRVITFRNADSDGDGIPNSTDNDDDDSDNDGSPNFADIDDDNDTYSTKIEISKTGTLAGPFYPFNNVVDNPATPQNETNPGIPDCGQNGINPTRIRRHLDPNCHN